MIDTSLSSIASSI